MPVGKDEYDSAYKIVLCGDVSVGKTHLFERVIHQKLPKSPQATIGVAFGVKTVFLPNGQQAKIRLWDTAGQEKFRAISANHFRRANGAVLVYDLTNHQSFLNAAQWLAEIRQNAGPETEIVLVGNKYDLVEQSPNARQVRYEVAAQFAQKSGISFIETSAVSLYNVDRMLTSLLSAIQEKQEREKLPVESHGGGGVRPARSGEAGRTRRLSEGTIRLDAESNANIIRRNENGCCANG